jgi:hypothetical protein
MLIGALVVKTFLAGVLLLLGASETQPTGTAETTSVELMFAG